MVPERSSGEGCCKVKVNGGCWPGLVVEGPLKVTARPAGTIGKTAACEADPEAESVTVTSAVSTVVSRAAGTVAVSWVALTYMVVSGVALKFTTDIDVKFEPVAV